MPSVLPYAPPYEQADGRRLDARAALQETITGWQSWSALHESYQGRHRRLVRRSALILQGPTYQRTGAVVAAAPTSVPEKLGGQLNWDYRFVWLAGALGELGEKPLQIMYGVHGERDLTEHSLDHLAGYRGSRPVHVGNDAWKQRQLDVLGEVLFAAHLLREQIGDFTEPVRQMLIALADQAARDWQQPDAGMWESRHEPRHYTTSKVMCWVALDRAVKLADQLGDGPDPQRWARARDDVRAAVLEQAWTEQTGAYAGAFGSGPRRVSAHAAAGGVPARRRPADARDHRSGRHPSGPTAHTCGAGKATPPDSSSAASGWSSAWRWRRV